MAEENQVMKEPQQVTTKEPQRVTTKDPKKVEVGKRLAAYNHKRREMKSEGPTTDRRVGLCQRGGASGGVGQYYGIGAVLAVGVIGGLGYYIYQSKKAQQPSHPQ